MIRYRVLSPARPREYLNATAINNFRSSSPYPLLIAMETIEHVIPTSTRRVTQRRPRACTECARRKLRCSKVIPCSACMDRGISHSCRREKVWLRNRKADGQHTMARSNTSDDLEQRVDRVHHISQSLSPSPSRQPSPSTQESIGMPFMDTASPYVRSSPITPGSDNDRLPVNPTAACRETLSKHGSSSEPGIFPCLSTTSQSGLMKGVAQNTAVTLEFLALGRQHAMRLGHDLAPESRASLRSNSISIADSIVTPAQAVWLVEYHEKNISWMHNLLHMATFREQCDVFLESGAPISPLWLSLYYSVLSVSLQWFFTYSWF